MKVTTTTTTTTLSKCLCNKPQGQKLKLFE
jgi:hypothetical protein